ncbi:DUF2927 domain-containing protein [Ekhidna sp.]
MKLKILSLAILTVLINACGDGESALEANLIVENFNASLTERPSDNQVIGNLIVTTNIDDVKYEIINQSIDDALSIDNSTGQIIVKDADLFDINVRDNIQAEVEVTGGDILQIAEVSVDLSLPEITIDYFKDIALGFENGGASEITRKWKTTMKIFIDGSPSSTLTTKVQQTVDDINELATDGFSVEIVQSQSQSNCYMYFGTASEFEALFPGSDVGTNFAIFNVWWNSDVINEARIFIDTERPTISQQLSVVLEEITQVLGLGKDSPRFSNSIFYETQTNGGFATQYSDVDRELVRLLYHPDMEIGLNSIAVDTKLRSIIRNEW